MRRRTLTNRAKLILGGGALLLLILYMFALPARNGGSAPSEEQDALARRAIAEAADSRRELERLRAQVGELDLRVRVLEQTSGYTTSTGVRLPAVPDPLATPPAPTPAP